MTPEDAVRAYLNFLADPSSMIDSAAIERLEEELRSSDDPIVKLRAAAALEAAQKPDGGALADGFIEHAKAWAASEGIPASAFTGAGVPDDVLRRAGLLQRRSGSKRKAQKAAPRASRVSVDDIKAWALSQSEPFTIRQATEQLGGSLVTAKKAFVELVEAGQLHEIGADPEHRGPGRAPVRFSTSQPRKGRRVTAKA